MTYNISLDILRLILIHNIYQGFADQHQNTQIFITAFEICQSPQISVVEVITNNKLDAIFLQKKKNRNKKTLDAIMNS